MNKKMELLREEQGLVKLFLLFKEKYRSLGKVSGTVSIEAFSDEEVAGIAGFLGQSEDRLKQKGKISLLAFEKELEKTTFCDYTLLPLLEEVLQESITTKNEETEKERELENAFIQALYHKLPDGAWWWSHLAAKSGDSRWIWSLYKQDSEDLLEKLTTVYQAYRGLPPKGEFERLPLFAQRMTGNPHFFDTTQAEGKLLLHCLHVDQLQKGMGKAVMPKQTEDINELLSFYGIMRDDLWSFVTCQGLLASNDKGIHPVWSAAIESGTVLNVPMKEMALLVKVWPAKGKKVWILENSSVCSTIMDEMPDAPIVCTHGQFRTASWLLIDLLVKTGSVLYYSGDLDPEGIMIAERLKKRYGQNVHFWRMNTQSYEDSVSNEDISAKLTKLDSITSPQLVQVSAWMKKRKKAGYQEALLSQLIRDIKKHWSGG